MFEVFRKYQKSMLAVLAILAMFAFILSGAIDSFSQRQAGGDSVVATAWNRKIRRSEVYEVAFERSKVNELLRRAAVHAKLGRMPGGFPTDSDNVIAGIALAMRAESLGISVNDQEVMDWLNKQTEDKLSAEDFKGLLSGTINPFQESAGGEKSSLGLSEFALFSALSRELAIERLLAVSLPPQATVLDAPIEVWNTESPKLTQIALEFVPVPVAKFIDAAAEPTPQQLQDTYNKYATVEPDPTNKKPGFLLPRRVTFDYLEANVASLAAAETVTDEEIAQYYEEHKTEFVEVPKPTTAPSPPAPEAPKEPATETPPAPAEGANPAPAEPTPTTPETPAEPPATPPTEGKLSAGPLPQGTWASSVARWMIASLTSYQESSPPAEAAPPAPAASTPPAEPAAPTPAAAAESTPDASPAATPEAPKSESAPAPSAEPTPAPAPPRQKSLEEVKEEIRLILQKQKGEKTLKAKMQGVIDSTLVPYRMDKYESARRDYEASHPAKEGAIDWTGFVPPPIPDMTKVAESLGAQLKTAGPVGVAELDKLGPLASAVRVDRRAGTGVPESLRRLAFGPNIGDDLYAGRMLFDVASGNCFVYWKTKDEPPKPQSLEEVKDQVIVLWRQESALPKAKELAQQIIDKAKGSEGKLDAGLPADQGMSVQSTDIFPRVRMIASSVTPGFEQPIEVKIANIPGAGEAFLDAAFKLKEGEFTVLADEKEENVYAVKVSKRIEPDFAAFAQRYRNDNVLRRQYAQYLGRETQALVMRQLLQEAKIDPPLFQPRQREMESSDSPVNTEG